MHFTSIVLIAIVQLYSSFSYAFCTYTSRWSSSHTLYSSHTLHTEELRPSPPTADIVLSAGNCAFAHHCGFLEGVEQALSVDRVGAVLGTSSGALVGKISICEDEGHPYLRQVVSIAEDIRVFNSMRGLRHHAAVYTHTNTQKHISIH